MINPNLFDFVTKCLVYDAEERLTSDSAIYHPFFKITSQFHLKINSAAIDGFF